MGNALVKLSKHDARLARDMRVKSLRKSSAEEDGALRKLRSEARAKGTELSHGGKGGLPSSLVLHVMRRDDYRCKTCGGQKDIGVHHKGGIVDSKWLARKGHQNVPNNLVTVCGACHDRLHEDAKARGVDSSQVQPEGDK